MAKLEKEEFEAVKKTAEAHGVLDEAEAVKRAGDIAPGKFRWRVDMVVR